MDLGRPEAANHFAVSERSVTLVEMELVSGIPLIELHHISVAGNLGYDGSKFNNDELFITSGNGSGKRGLPDFAPEIEAAVQENRKTGMINPSNPGFINETGNFHVAPKSGEISAVSNIYFFNFSRINAGSRVGDLGVRFNELKPNGALAGT